MFSESDAVLAVASHGQQFTGTLYQQQDVREFDFPQGLKASVYDARSGTTEEAAEKVGKRDSRPAEAREE
jgi:hypothetical protein